MKNAARKPIVIKIGGSTLGSHDTTLEDLVTLQRQGFSLVVVHGGAAKVTEWLKRQGTETVIKDGIRITDEKSLEMVAAVLGGLVNSDLVAAVNALGGRAFGMTGVDGNLLECRIEDPAMGYAGKIVRVNPPAVEAVMRAGFIPMIAPPGARAPEEKTPVPYININGDDIAGELAAALGAETVIFLTDIDGIHGADGKVIPRLSRDEVRALMASGVIKGGMIPKAKGALAALAKSPTVRIVDGRAPHALLAAVEGKGIGTLIRA